MINKKYKELYFHIRDDLFKNYNTGYTRVELHILMKEHVLPLLIEEDACWKPGTERVSTSDLSDKGWQLFIEHLKVWLGDVFLYIAE